MKISFTVESGRNDLGGAGWGRGGGCGGEGGGAKRLGGETTRGKRPGRKRLGGETTRGGNGLGPEGCWRNVSDSSKTPGNQTTCGVFVP